MIRLADIHKSFGSHEVLKGVNLDVKEGEKLVIIGPSGSGKSTTVRCMNGLETPTSGHVYIDNTELTRQNRISLVRSTSSMVSCKFSSFSCSSTWAFRMRLMLSERIFRAAGDFM